MADCLGFLWEQADNSTGIIIEKDRTEILLQQGPLIGNTFEQVRLLDRKDGYDRSVVNPGGFTKIDHILQCVEMDDCPELVPEFPYNWHYDGMDTERRCFEMEITCRALVLIFKDTGDADASKADIYVDGRFVRTADPFVNGWVHCNPMIIIREDESSNHFVRIEPERGKKCSILGFGYVK